MIVHGVLLAAGAGRRMGTPKALVEDWAARSVDALRGGGCTDVLVVIGARAEEVRERLAPLAVAPLRITVVEAADWADGMSASLRTGLSALAGHDPAPEAALVTLVDLPDVGPDVVARVLAAPVGPGTLRRAAYHHRPGHPVLIGRHHWPAVIATATGDAGARAYLARHDVETVECGDLATGRDRDHPDPTSTEDAR